MKPWYSTWVSLLVTHLGRPHPHFHHWPLGQCHMCRYYTAKVERMGSKSSWPLALAKSSGVSPRSLAMSTLAWFSNSNCTTAWKRRFWQQLNWQVFSWIQSKPAFCIHQTSSGSVTSNDLYNVAHVLMHHPKSVNMHLVSKACSHMQRCSTRQAGHFSQVSTLAQDTKQAFTFPLKPHGISYSLRFWDWNCLKLLEIGQCFGGIDDLYMASFWWLTGPGHSECHPSPPARSTALRGDIPRTGGLLVRLASMETAKKKGLCPAATIKCCKKKWP